MAWCSTRARCALQTAEVYRKLRFTLRYLLGNLADFEPAGHSVPVQRLPLLDRWGLPGSLCMLRTLQGMA